MEITPDIMVIQNNPGHMEGNAFSESDFVAYSEALGLCLFKDVRLGGAGGPTVR